MRNGFHKRILLPVLLLGLAAGGSRAVAQSNAPVLRLVNSNQTVRVFWPNSGYYHLLQTSSNLADTNSWVSIASAFPTAYAISNLNGGIYQLPPALTTNNEFYSDRTKFPGNWFFRLKQPDFLPLCSFAIFYDGLLEFSQSATLIVNGPVHANGSIYVGTSAQIYFNQTVTCTGWITAPFVDGITSGWTPGNPANWNTTFYGTPQNITNVPPLALWTATNDYHTLIDVPPAGESVATFPGNVRLFNQAAMVLLVTNAVGGTGNPTAELTLQTSVNGNLPGADPAPLVLVYTNASAVVLATNLPFLALTNQFYDQREYKTNLVTQIDIGVLGNWLQTNSTVLSKFPSGGTNPTILFVADQRNYTARQMDVVRLVNGSVLPANGGIGFSIATPNPLYVKGNYNTQLAGNSGSSAGTSDTTYTVPAALFCDALTVLSSHWSDSVSFTSAYFTGNPNYNATSTNTVNGVLVMGNVPSTGLSATNFSGGVHNLVRLLEDWFASKLWLNGSRARLWTSQTATNQFRNPYGFNPAPVNGYYNPPTRHYSYDYRLLNLNRTPPGVPILVYPNSGQ